jgi:uncharacterized protein DUF4124
MSSGRIAGIVALASVLWGASAGAEIYRWTDASGHERFSTEIRDVPAAQRPEAARREMSGRHRVTTVDPAVPQAPAPPPAETTPAGVGAPATQAPTSGAAAIGGDDEAGWRAHAAKLRADIERLEGAAEHCQEYAPQRWKPGSGQQGSETAECRRKAGDLQFARSQLDELLENARRLGVPPGWVR